MKTRPSSRKLSTKKRKPHTGSIKVDIIPRTLEGPEIPSYIFFLIPSFIFNEIPAHDSFSISVTQLSLFQIKKNKVLIKQEDNGSHMKTVNGQLYDFRCHFCKVLPRYGKPCRSELYRSELEFCACNSQNVVFWTRHYSLRHYSKELREEFGPAQVRGVANWLQPSALLGSPTVPSAGRDRGVTITRTWAKSTMRWRSSCLR